MAPWLLALPGARLERMKGFGGSVEHNQPPGVTPVFKRLRVVWYVSELSIAFHLKKKELPRSGGGDTGLLDMREASSPSPN